MDYHDLLDSPPEHMVFLSFLSNMLASFRLHMCPLLSRCSPTAVLGCQPAVCALYLVTRILSVSPMYFFLQLSYFGWYTMIVAPWVFCPLVSLVSLSQFCLLVVVHRHTMFLENSLKLF